MLCQLYVIRAALEERRSNAPLVVEWESPDVVRSVATGNRYDVTRLLAQGRLFWVVN